MKKDMELKPGFYPPLDAKTVTSHHKTSRTNSTGYLGVKWHKRCGVFEAWIRVHGKKNKVYAGRAKTARGAAQKYDEKARELYGPDAVTNFDA